eukprot:UN08153
MQSLRIRNSWNDSSPVIYSVFARIRIKQELNELLENPIEAISCGPINVNNLLHWSAVFRGPEHTPYSNGTYYLLIDFPNSYPMRGPNVRYDFQLCNTYHKNVDASGNIISMLNDQKWWHGGMRIKDLLIKIKGMFHDDDLNTILDIPQISKRYNNCHGLPLLEHITKACLYNNKYCNGARVPVWLLCNNKHMLHVTKNKHEKDIQKIQQLFYANTTFCVGITDIIVSYYGNQWHLCK